MAFTDKIRKPAVAGMFYPANPVELTDMINGFLNEVDLPEINFTRLLGLVAPHAGYIYSGPIAAYSYKLLINQPVRRFVVIAPSHREYFTGFSVYPGRAIQTPLGTVSLDFELARVLLENCRSLNISEDGHREEHSLEVQLPFLQTLFGNDISIVPIVMGDAGPGEVNELAQALSVAGTTHDFVVIASSDLSHYHPYDVANIKDNHLISVLEQYDLQALGDGFQSHELEACGIGPILTLMLYARRAGAAKFTKLNHRNSGDTAGMRSQVVGYLAGAVHL